MFEDPQLNIITMVGIAMLLGGLIGVEREIADKPAGLRTHMLVAGAAALLVALGDIMLDRFEAEATIGIIRSDPIRIVEAIITGISFLGAGTIIRSERGSQVEGLTTAASVLFVAAIGVAVALEQIVLSVGVTLLVLIILRGFYHLESWVQTKLTSPPE